jgi:hemerythrin
MRAFLEWLDDWYLGIQEIDRQHLEMAELLNKIVYATEHTLQPSQTDEAAMPLLMQLLEKTRRHFKVEEAVMRENDYPKLAEHHRDHVLLLAELQGFIRELEEGKRVFSVASMTSLKHWLINHVVESDLDFARYLQGS